MTTNMLFLLFAVILCGVGGKVWGKTEGKVGCDHHYFQHYLVKNCTPVYGPNSSDCPIRFNCPPPASPETSGCRVQGKLFQPDQDIPTGNPCQLCSCSPGRNDGAPEIVCKKEKCRSTYRGRDVPPFLHDWDLPPSQRDWDLPPFHHHCYATFERDKCCSTGMNCINIPLRLDESIESVFGSPTTCVHNGKTFYPGQRIYPDEDPCVVCICGKGWTGNVNSDPNCIRQNCILEKDMKLLTLGCLPIYQESTCCPIEFECRPQLQSTTTPLATTEEIVSGNTCIFKGSHYRIGQHLDIYHPRNCITCTCTTPPEFTCVHENCRYTDDKSCAPIYSPGICCTDIYNCIWQ